MLGYLLASYCLHCCYVYLEIEMKTRVSGVPYEVDMPETKHTLNGLLDDVESYIAELERENLLMRARMDRLENELRLAEAEAARLKINLENERNKKS